MSITVGFADDDRRVAIVVVAKDAAGMHTVEAIIDWRSALQHAEQVRLVAAQVEKNCAEAAKASAPVKP